MVMSMLSLTGDLYIRLTQNYPGNARRCRQYN